MWKWLTNFFKGFSVESKVNAFEEQYEVCCNLSKISQSNTILNLILDLQFSSDKRYIAFKLSKALEAENIYLAIQELNFFKELCDRLRCVDTVTPLENQFDVIDLLQDIDYDTNKKDYSSSLYYHTISSELKDKEAKNCVPATTEPFIEEAVTTNEPIDSSSIKAFAKEKLNINEDEESLDDLLSRTSSALR